MPPVLFQNCYAVALINHQFSQIEPSQRNCNFISTSRWDNGELRKSGGASRHLIPTFMHSRLKGPGVAVKLGHLASGQIQQRIGIQPAAPRSATGSRIQAMKTKHKATQKETNMKEMYITCKQSFHKATQKP